LRDSIGNEFTTEADGTVYFGSTASSILNNPTSFANAHILFNNPEHHQRTGMESGGGSAAWFAGLNGQLHEIINGRLVVNWAEVEGVLGLPANVILDIQYSALASAFAAMESLSYQERFLNMLAEPIVLDLNKISNFHYSDLQNVGFHSVCTIKVNKLKQHLGLALTAGLEVQRGLGIDDPLNEEINAIRRKMMERIALLSVIYDAAAEQPNNLRHDIHPMFMSVGGNGPFSLTAGVLSYGNDNTLGVTTLSFNSGNIHVFAENIVIDPVVARNVNISPVLNGAGAGQLMLALELAQILNKHEFSTSSFVMSQLSSSALSSIKGLIKSKAPVAASVFEAALLMYKFNSEWNKSLSIQNDFIRQHDVAMFGDFLRDFSMQTIIIQEEGQDWRSMTWPTVDSEIGLSGLNSLNINDNDISLPWITQTAEQIRVANASNPFGPTTSTAPGAIQISFNLDPPPGVALHLQGRFF